MVIFCRSSNAFFPIFNCVDPNPYSEYRSGSTKLPNMDPQPWEKDETGPKMSTLLSQNV